jgi:hypothetical protein
MREKTRRDDALMFQIGIKRSFTMRQRSRLLFRQPAPESADADM